MLQLVDILVEFIDFSIFLMYILFILLLFPISFLDDPLNFLFFNVLITLQFGANIIEFFSEFF